MKTILTAAIALSIVASAGAASAQGPQRSDQHQQQGQQDHQDRGHQDQGRQGQGPQGPGKGDNNNYERNASKRYKAPSRYQPPRGYQAGHQWRRGEKLPSSYRGKGYVVDYRHYGLSAPPRGYQYVRVNNDVVLTAIATGVVASVIYQLFQ
jgi:Ni/Co efflux regulator RcnB